MFALGIMLMIKKKNVFIFLVQSIVLISTNVQIEMVVGIKWKHLVWDCVTSDSSVDKMLRATDWLFAVNEWN